MERQGHVAGGMCEIPENVCTQTMCLVGDGRDVEKLAGAEVDTAHEDERNRVARGAECFENVVGAK